jgi:hypothetical protein
VLNKTPRLAALLLVAGSLILNHGWAQEHERRAEPPEASDSFGDTVRRTLLPSEPVFTVHDRTVVAHWLGSPKALPPGLAKREYLPPGQEKQLRQRGTLPPGLQKKIQPLPLEIERQLSLLPTGYRRVVIGNNVVLVNERTALIYDIIRVVIP